VVFLWLGNNSIIIMDNCGIYWSQRVLDMCREGEGESGYIGCLLIAQFEPNWGGAFAIISLICEGTTGKSMGSIQTLEIT
jgi:hypothetical protein